MSKKKNTNESTSGNSKKSFLEKLPSNVPFVPLVRRPDYRLRRLKIRIPRSIPASLIIVMMLMGVFFIYIGGFYFLTHDEVLPFGTDPETGEPEVIFKDVHEQFIFEGIAAGILMYIGAGGMYLIHKSTSFAYSPRQATTYLLIGIGLVTLALGSIMYMFIIKTGIIEELIAKLKKLFS